MLNNYKNIILLLFISQTLFGQIQKIFSDVPKLYSIFGNSVNIEGDYLIATSKEPYYSPYRQKYLRAFLFKYENNKWIQKDTLAGAIFNQSFNDLGLSYMSFSGKTAFFRRPNYKNSIDETKIWIYDISNDKFELTDSITNEKKLIGKTVLIASSQNWLFVRTQSSSKKSMIDYFYKKKDNKWIFSDSLEYKYIINGTGLFRTQMDEQFIVTSYGIKEDNKFIRHALIYKFINNQWNIFSDFIISGGSSMAYTEDLKYIASAWNDTIKIYKYNDGKYILNQNLHADFYKTTTIFAPSIAISNGYLYAGYYDYVYRGNHGEVYQYILDDDLWKLRKKIKPSYPDTTFMHFGESLSISGKRLAIGADYDYTYGPNRGAIYIYSTPVKTNLIDTICEGNDYIFHDTILQTTGIYTDTLLTYYDMDSIVILNLTVIPQSQIILDTMLCEGDSIILGDSIITKSGYYEFYFNRINNCESFVKANIKFDSLEVLDSIFPDFGCNSGEISLNIEGNNPPYNLTWDTGKSTKNIQSLESGTYYLTISSNNNCHYEYEYEVPSKAPYIIVPNAFFPEGSEEINKIFKPYLSDTENVKIISTEIFNRWGEKVFSSSENNFWDGSYKHKKISPEVFLYRIIVRSPCGIEVKKGQVSLLK